MRIWLRGKLVHFKGIMFAILQVCVSRAEAELDILMPGYTHFQRAQSVWFSHWLLSYATFVLADLQRLDGVAQRTNCSTLGVGALSGNPFALDRDFLAKELEFTSIHPNSMAAVADRDFVVETLQ